MENKILQNHNPNGVGVKGTFLGLPCDENTAEVVIIPVPWDVTVSYGAGTAYAPQTLLEASSQLDLEIRDIDDAWKIGYALTPVDQEVLKTSIDLRKEVESYIEKLESGEITEDKSFTSVVNQNSENLNNWVSYQTDFFLKKGKVVGLLGGDHSIPLGFLKALAARFPDFGILQIDAHADLREAYEGFDNSHASIMFNALELPQVSKLVQVGVRDYCPEERQRINESADRIVTFFDQDIKESQFAGESWDEICDKIVSNLPSSVYVSFDIDGLNPKLCPSTGTPVPGGFELEETLYLVKKIVSSGRRIIGFDLSELGLGPDEWDANVGARLLYRLSALTAVSQGKLSFR